VARTSSRLSRKTKSGCLVTPRSKHPRSLLFCLPPSTGLEYAARSEPTAFVSSARLPAAPCESLSGQACFEEPSFAVTFAVTLSVQTLSVQTLSVQTLSEEPLSEEPLSVQTLSGQVRPFAPCIDSTGLNSRLDPKASTDNRRDALRRSCSHWGALPRRCLRS
jgi:hypothetical protein